MIAPPGEPGNSGAGAQRTGRGAAFGRYGDCIQHRQYERAPPSLDEAERDKDLVRLRPVAISDLAGGRRQVGRMAEQLYAVYLKEREQEMGDG